jgi:putative polyketide hydroxylase
VTVARICALWPAGRRGYGRGVTPAPVPVAIVGAGGAGLALSLLLHQQGIASVVVERRTDISWVPRARNLNFRTLEVFRGLGMEADVLAAGTTVSHGFRKTTLAAAEQEEIIDPSSLEPPGLQEITPEPLYWYCPQSRLEPLLLAKARERGSDVRYGVEMAGFVQDDHGVTLTLHDRATGAASELRAEYLAACDGAHSHVRQALGIATQGHGPLPEHIISVYFRAPWQRLIAGHESDAILVDNADVQGILMVAKDDLGMLMVTYQGSPEGFTHERCRELVERAIGQPDLPVDVIDVVRWQPAEDVAERFQASRVFLVGDAAHTMPGYKGLGLNTGIQSAQNLAWKLAAVLAGRAAPALLATYHVERHPVGRFAARQSLTGPGAVLVPGKTTLLPPGEEMPIFYPIAGYRYGEADEIALLDEERLTGLPGTRVPHLWLERDGRDISTLDLLDGRFLLLFGGGAWTDASAAASERLGIGIAACRVGAEEGWPAKLGAPPDGAVLVRPDGFVAWRGGPDVSLEETLARVLHLRD